MKPEIFFDPQNEMSNEARTRVRKEVTDSMISWLKEAGQVAVYDTTNATVEMRKALSDKLANSFTLIGPSRGPDASPPSSAKKNNNQKAASVCHLIWIECCVSDATTIERNFFESTYRSIDFKGLSPENAFSEFKKKETNYLKNYVGLEEQGEELNKQTSFIKISDTGKRIVLHNISGYLESKIVSFVLNIHTQPRVILLARHGQTEYNENDRLGGDSDLNDNGKKFGQNVAKFCKYEEDHEWFLDRFSQSKEFACTNFDDAKATVFDLDLVSSSSSTTASPVKPNNSNNNNNNKKVKIERKETSDLVIWTSTAKRSIQTAAPINSFVQVPWNALSEIDAGGCEGMTYMEIKTKMPLEYAERQMDKFHWRYPRGESYSDVVKRLEPVIFEIERQKKPVLVVAHRAVVRLLLGYFFGTPKNAIPYLPLPLHMVIKISSTRHGWHCEKVLVPPVIKGDDGLALIDQEEAGVLMRSKQQDKTQQEE